MDQLSAPQKRKAECVGLWLAEGSLKSKTEITFTNNCWDLIDLFYRTINEIFKNYEYNLRIYVYSKNKEKVKIPYKNCKVKYYFHDRATKPFFIFRLASVEVVRAWKKMVKETLSKKELSPYILRGFFAGEGNIKEVSRNSRVLRISQKSRKDFVDNALSNLKINFSYDSRRLTYTIYGKKNWDIFAKFKLADLHPDKKDKFWKIYKRFKEEHYEKNYLVNHIFPLLEEPLTARQLSNTFNRSLARIQDILIELKKQKEVNNFRVGSVDYWTKNKDLIIISKLKNNYLLFLDKPKQTYQFAKKFKVCWKSSFRRLKELEKLNLVRRQKDGRWIKLQISKNILAI